MRTGWHIKDQVVLVSNQWAQAEIRSLTHETGPSLPDFLVYRMKNFVQVVGITPAGKLVLVKEDRKVGGWSVEAIAGDIKKGELPITAAAREFNEETDYLTNSCVYLGRHHPDTNRGASLSAGSRCWTGYLIVACDLIPAPPQREASEIIETVEVSFTDALHCVMHPGLKLPGLNLPILSTGTQSIIKSIRLRADLYQLVH